MRIHRMISIAAMGPSVAALAGLLTIASPAAAGNSGHGAFAGLAGSWTGDGTVTMSNGQHERIRCRATYTVQPMGSSLNQGLRCASDSYTFDVKSNLIADSGGGLSGTWSETTRQVTGEVSGRIEPGRIQTTVEALGFTAHLSVSTQGSHQSVSIEPENSEIQAVRVEMRRI